jgi:hypothetical protein
VAAKRKNKEVCAKLVREICRINDIEIVKGHGGKEHVHLFVSVADEDFKIEE